MAENPNTPNPKSVDTITFLRQFRFGGYALFDLAISFLGMALMSPLLSGLFRRLGIEIPKRNWIFLTLPLALATHVAIGKYTLMTRDFFDVQSHYLVKFIIVLSLSLGLMDIKRLKR